MPNEEMKKVVTKVQPRSGFDKSHQNLFSSKVGTITPILFDEVIPNTKVHCRIALSAALPPLASDTFMRCSVKVEAFFVPMRLLFPQTFESWFTGKDIELHNGEKMRGLPPMFALSPGLYPGDSSKSVFWNDVQDFFKLGTLADYLGFRHDIADGQFHSSGRTFSCMPFEVYHFVWNEWYRNARIQKPAFVQPVHEDLASNGTNQHGSMRFMSLPYSRPGLYSPDNETVDHHLIYTERGSENPDYNPFICADGVSMFSLRQRNFGADYFTTALTSPQMGEPSRVVINSPENSFSIAALRVANAMQEFRENNGLISPRTVEVVKQRYGANLSDGLAQRPLLLGTGDFEVYSKGVYQNGSAQNSQNPFNSVAARFGSAHASGSEFVIDGFVANEPGYILINATLVPRVTYATGYDKQLLKYRDAGCLMDMATPEFQRVGMQEISAIELTGNFDSEPHVFGYADRFSEYMQKFDTIHGSLRTDLASFALQRVFIPSIAEPEINSSFLEIPTDYMDNVTAVRADLSNYGYWCDCYFDYKVSQPLGKWVVPSLENPAKEHGDTVVMKRGGLSL